ncbi:PREDICTED: uncharacterized protein LOC102023164 [Chinchilla lanigera]|uniref:uncharacterized protein LOC102023164 n=1 Tax=Chinchilla lanigera TaxID=34839 RepID=UPI00038ED64A|nr:PREDICTED: uncharacterized protein LOC102023164 [Chinchilla lanigera]
MVPIGLPPPVSPEEGGCDPRCPRQGSSLQPARRSSGHTPRAPRRPPQVFRPRRREPADPVPGGRGRASSPDTGSAARDEFSGALAPLGPATSAGNHGSENSPDMTASQIRVESCCFSVHPSPEDQVFMLVPHRCRRVLTPCPVPGSQALGLPQGRHARPLCLLPIGKDAAGVGAGWAPGGRLERLRRQEEPRVFRARSDSAPFPLLLGL